VPLELKKADYDGKELVKLKIDIVRNLIEVGFAKEKIQALMNFITYYVRLEPKHINTMKYIKRN
jgi:hypothetical protein